MTEHVSRSSEPAVKDPVRERKRSHLEMQREYILNQRTSHPDRRAALQAALRQIEEELRTLD